MRILGIFITGFATCIGFFSPIAFIAALLIGFFSNGYKWCLLNSFIASIVTIMIVVAMKEGGGVMPFNPSEYDYFLYWVFPYWLISMICFLLTTLSIQSIMQRLKRLKNEKSE